MEKTQSVRNSENLLFSTTIKPFKAVSDDTISRWIKDLRGLAGIFTNVFKPNSTCSASTNYERQLVPIETIIKAGDYLSKLEIFIKNFDQSCITQKQPFAYVLQNRCF